MAVSNVPKVPRDGQITLKDNGAETLVIDYEAGDFSFSDDRTERVVIRDRGTIVGLRKGEDSVGSFSFSCMMRDFMDASGITIIDAIENTNGASAWVSTGGTNYEQFLLDCELAIEGTDHGDTGDHKLTLSKCFLVWDFAEDSGGNKINVTGEVYGTRVRTEA